MSKAPLRSALIALVGIFMLAVATPAHAALILQLSDGTSTVQVVDGGAGDLDGTVNGQIIWNGSVGVFTTNVEVGLSAPIIGSPTTASLDLTTTNVSGGAGTLTIALTDTGFTQAPIGNLSWQWGGTVTGGTITGQGYLDPTNTAFGTSSITTGALGPYTGAFSTSGSTPHGALLSPYSLTITEALTTTGFALASGDFELNNTPVPEPASLVLLGTGLFSLAAVARRRRKGKKQNDLAVV